MAEPKRSRAAIASAIALAGATFAALAVVGWIAWTGAPLRAAREEARAGRPQAALDHLDVADGRPGHAAAEAELRGLVLLETGRAEEAAGLLERVRRSAALGEPPLPLEPLAARLLTAGREAELSVLVEHAAAAGPLSAPLLAQAGFARHAEGDLAGALERYREALARGVQGRLRETVETMLARAAEEARSGRVPVVLDREGRALAWREAGGALATGPELTALLGDEPLTALPGLDASDLDGRIELELDASLQRRAMAMLVAEEGAFVAVDPRTGGVLAAAADTQAPALLALSPAFQPGSTLKVLTLAAWLESGRPAAELVPHDCKGNDFVVDGEILYDWAPHGNVASLERALSTSCNTVFARIGLELGEARLRQAFAPLGFGASTEPGAAPTDGSGLPSASGERLPSGALAAGPLDPVRLARTAIGLDATLVSPLQAAALAVTVARDGQLPALRFVRRRMNVVGEPLPEPEPVAPVRVFSAKTAAAVESAMLTVVTDRDGTGRGARTAGRAASGLALKTGTTGGDGGPLNAVFVGHLPAGEPELAFSLFTQGSGRSLDVSRRVLGPFLEDAWSDRGRADVSN